ncbi:hypothetical protein Q3V23_19040 [Streptomyces sp. VNUA116]|uniref:hypothetical protein n=1 Tax=Streptomyces sp. VNUA116 TaxID=3062449 RepID=UPI0026774382|nr:hypothetical protein [Streptomyces sp. VNUA116]WKU45986.1 hypothetical protein Q3V23_19040 [Streptomyces sp. VNUA116]
MNTSGAQHQAAPRPEPAEETPDVPHPAAHRAAAHLATIRQHWAELLLAIETPPADTWPPRQLAHTLRPANEDPLDVLDRAPLVLRQHPAPLNLDALDVGLSIETDLFDLADVLASDVQHAGLDDPRRWTIRSATDPGSRAHGLHWAALYVEGRLLDEDTTPEEQPDGTLAPAPFAPVSELRLRQAAHIAHQCAGRLLRVLQLDQRATPIPGRPCPWCGGELTLHTGPDEGPSVTCGWGPQCAAPVPLTPAGRRVWEWHALPALVAALNAEEQHERQPARLMAA